VDFSIFSAEFDRLFRVLLGFCWGNWFLGRFIAVFG